MPRPPMPPGVEQMEAEADHTRQKLSQHFESLLHLGFWFCKDCQRECQRIEDDHGQPASCHRCHGHRIHFVEPIYKKEAK